MTVQLKRHALDLGIVTGDVQGTLAFYCDTLGFELVADLPIPGVGVVKKLRCGDSFIKILAPSTAPAIKVPRGGLAAATGFRYFSLSVRNIEEIVQKCRHAGYTISVDVRELRPGVRVALIEDPEGNTLELLEEPG